MEMKLVSICKYPLKFDYYVTDDGRVWSGKSKKFLSQSEDKNGYMKVGLCSTDLPPKKVHRYSVHRLIMENFCPIEGMENLQVNHIDGDKKNNCLSNLEWTTCEENIHHAIANGLRAKVNGASKLTPEQVLEIYHRSWDGESNVSLSKEFGVHPDTIGQIRNKKTWKEILCNVE